MQSHHSPCPVLLAGRTTQINPTSEPHSFATPAAFPDWRPERNTEPPSKCLSHRGARDYNGLRRGERNEKTGNAAWDGGGGAGEFAGGDGDGSGGSCLTG